MGILEDMLMPVVQQKMKVPTKDLPKVQAATAKYTEDGEPVELSVLKACDLALIEYVIDRIKKGK
jgi:hypothetical protein